MPPFNPCIRQYFKDETENKSGDKKCNNEINNINNNNCYVRKFLQQVINNRSIAPLTTSETSKIKPKTYND